MDGIWRNTDTVQKLMNRDGNTKSTLVKSLTMRHQIYVNVLLWNVENVWRMSHIFEQSGMSTNNYDDTLIGWDSLSTRQQSVPLDSSAHYCRSENQRQDMITNDSWTINDAGLDPACSNGNMPGFTVSPISGDTSEDGISQTFTVVLNSQPTDDVTIPTIISTDSTEGTVDKSSLTFTPSDWDTPQIVTVTGVDDSIVDGAVPYMIKITKSVSQDLNYNGINPDDVAVNNLDNDTIGFTVTPITGDTSEDGIFQTFTVVINTEPQPAPTFTLRPSTRAPVLTEVTIPLSSDDTTEGIVSPTSLTFNQNNWNTPQTVTVTGVDDSIVDGTIPYHVVLGTVTSSDFDYNGLDPDDVAVDNLETMTIIHFQSQKPKTEQNLQQIQLLK